MAKAQNNVEAVEGFIGKLDNGAEVVYRIGDLVEADHPAVKKWPHLFREPKLVDQAPDVEKK